MCAGSNFGRTILNFRALGTPLSNDMHNQLRLPPICYNIFNRYRAHDCKCNIPFNQIKLSSVRAVVSASIPDQLTVCMGRNTKEWTGIVLIPSYSRQIYIDKGLVARSWNVQHIKSMDTKNCESELREKKQLVWLYIFFTIFMGMSICTLYPDILCESFALKAAVILAGKPWWYSELEMGQTLRWKFKVAYVPERTRYMYTKGEYNQSFTATVCRGIHAAISRESSSQLSVRSRHLIEHPSHQNWPCCDVCSILVCCSIQHILLVAKQVARTGVLAPVACSDVLMYTNGERIGAIHCCCIFSRFDNWAIYIDDSCVFAVAKKLKYDFKRICWEQCRLRTLAAWGSEPSNNQSDSAKGLLGSQHL
jgi:hypothetical protein